MILERSWPTVPPHLFWVEVLGTCHQPFDYPHRLHLCRLCRAHPLTQKTFPPLVWDWRRSHRSNNQEGLRRTKELHLLDHCCRQHLRHRPTADDGRARCLVMEHPLHRCDGCGFIFSIARIITSATTWQDAASCCTHITTTYLGRRCGFILSISYQASLVLVFNDALSSPRCEKTKKKKENRHQSRFYDQFSAFTRVPNSSHAHHPQTGSIASTFSR